MSSRNALGVKFFLKMVYLMVMEKTTVIYLAKGGVKMTLRVLSSLVMVIYRYAGSKTMAILGPFWYKELSWRMSAEGFGLEAPPWRVEIYKRSSAIQRARNALEDLNGVPGLAFLVC
jgi:hypothetical protein